MAALGAKVRRDELKQVINRAIPVKERIELVAELARGVVLMEDGPDGKRVYGKPPDLAALRFLEEYATGKPVQVTEIPAESGFAFITIPKQEK